MRRMPSKARGAAQAERERREWRAAAADRPASSPWRREPDDLEEIGLGDSMTSRVWRPIEPVAPTTMTRLRMALSGKTPRGGTSP